MATPQLLEPDRLKLDGIVSKMVENGESDDDIQFVVNDFKQKYAAGSQPRVKQGVNVPFTPFQVDASPSDIIKATQKLTTGAYKYGGKPGDKAGTDCSGAMCVIAKQAGIDLPRTAKAQFEDKRAKPVDANDLKPGDLVFFGSPGPSGWHVGFYQGGGKFLHQSTDSKPGLSIGDLNQHAKKYGFRGAKRYDELSAKFAGATPQPQGGLTQEGVRAALDKLSPKPKQGPTQAPLSENLILKALEPQPDPVKSKPPRKPVGTVKDLVAQQDANQKAKALQGSIDRANLHDPRSGGPTEAEINPAGASLVPSDQTGPRKVLEQTLGDPYRTVTEKVGRPLQQAIGKHIRNLSFGLSPLQKAIETTNPGMSEEEVDEAVGTWLGVPENVDTAAINAALAAGGPLALKAGAFLLKASKNVGKLAEAFGPDLTKKIEGVKLTAADELKFAPKVETPSGLPPNLQPKPKPVVEAKGAKAQDTYFHGTSEGAFRRIREEGLDPKKSNEQVPTHLWLANAQDYAETYAQRKGGRTLRIRNAADAKQDARIPAGGDFMLNRRVPPSDIDVLVDGKWVPIQEYADEARNIMPITPPTPLKGAKEPFAVDVRTRLSPPQPERWGEDVIAYHGTPTPNFDIKDIRPSKSGEQGPGVYFDIYPEQAQIWAEGESSGYVTGKKNPGIFKARIRLKNPATEAEWEKAVSQAHAEIGGEKLEMGMLDRDIAHRANEILREKGHDGIQAMHELVVFDTSRIEAALKGTQKPPTHPTPPKGAKEPWEMTAKEWDKAKFSQHTLTRGDVSPDGFKKGIGPNVVSATTGREVGFEKRWTTSAGKPVVLIPKDAVIDGPNGGYVRPGFVPAHKVIPSYDNQPLREAFVETALKEGKPVPAEVLADYPDLAAKYGGKGAKEAWRTDPFKPGDKLRYDNGNEFTVTQERPNGYAVVDSDGKTRFITKPEAHDNVTVTKTATPTPKPTPKPLESIGGPPREIPLSKPTGETATGKPISVTAFRGQEQGTVGRYYTVDKDAATKYASDVTSTGKKSEVVEKTFAFKNPLVVTGEELRSFVDKTGKTIKNVDDTFDAVRDAGYDGLVIKGKGGVPDTIVDVAQKRRDDTIDLAAGFNPLDIIKKADDLNTPNFTLERRPKDWSTAEQFRSPLDIVDSEGRVLQTGSYSRLAGAKGAKGSEAIRSAEQRVTQASQGYNRAIDVIKDVLDNVRGAGTAKKLAEVLPGKAKRTRDEFYESFVDLVERDYTDPVRASVTGPLKEALDMHDALTEKWRQSISDNRRALGETMPDDWGVTEKGYFRHLFLGDFVLKDGADVIGSARTYSEAQKKALEYVKRNPGANITAQARDMSFGDPTLRVTNRKYWKTVGQLSDSVGLSMDEIMEDIRGIVGRKGGRQKFLGALLKRKGVGGYSKSYEEVMRIHAAQLVRSQELSRLNKELAPIIEEIGKELPGVANAMQVHLDTLWGVPTAGEKAFGESVMRLWVARNFVGSPAMAARGLARRLTGFQSLMKLHLGVRAPIINALQPFSTLWPYVKTEDFVKIYGDYMKPATRQMLREKGVLSSATKLESGGIIASKKLKSPFNAASDMNRGIGYLYGYRGALKKGLSEEVAHKSGLAWAEKVEFDNSLWNAPPAIRGPGGRVFGQFKGFTIKNLEHLGQLGKRQPGDTKLTRAARVMKGLSALGAQGGVSALTVGAKVVGAATVVNAVRDALMAEGMDKEWADKFAMATAYGVPSLFGADISGSVTVLDEPFGETWQEKLVNFGAGPTVTMIGRGVQETFSDKPINEKVGRIGKAITPAAKQVDAVQQFIQSGPKGVKVRVGKDEWVTLSPQEAMLMALGFQPVKVSKYYDDKEIKEKSKKSPVPAAAQPVSGKKDVPAEAKPVG